MTADRRQCYFHNHGHPPCGAVEFFWELPRGAETLRAGEWNWLALCARCCMVMRKHDVEVARITNIRPDGVPICYADEVAIHSDERHAFADHVVLDINDGRQR